MKDLVIETIKLYYGDLEDVSTEEFYKDYLKICEEHKVEPEPRKAVTEIACDQLGLKSKKKTISVFARKDD